MANIGTFKKIRTGNSRAKVAALSPPDQGRPHHPNRQIEQATNAPKPQGLCRPRRDRRHPVRSAPHGSRDYLSVKLDDPSFNPRPIYANLFDDEDAETFTLIWSRSRKPNID